jgi:1-acyl-sn-glycerol-3-phosphate acyltransferase
MVRTAFIMVWTVLATVVLGSVCIFFGYFSKTGNLPHIVARFWANSILVVSGIRVTLHGRDNLIADRPVIYMVNHQSNFDIPVLLGRLPVQFRWLAKAELFRIPILGRGMKGSGYISIDRSNRRSAMQSLAQAAETIRNGTSVLIFPEGTRSQDGNLQSFKKGGFVLTVDAGVPVIPMTICGTWPIMPKDRLLIRPRPVTLTILPPVDTSAFSRKTKDDLMDVIHRQLSAAIAKQRGNNACS